MESRSKKIYKVTRIISFIIVLEILLVVIYSVNKKIDINNKLTKEAIEINKLNNEIKLVKSIDKKLSNKYDEYYKNINKLEKKIINKRTNKKIAYLTFDDGPYDLTNKVLDVLKEENVKATFFTLGKESKIDKYKRIVNEGHVLANHTFYHDISKNLYQSKDSFINEVKLLEDFLKNKTGYKTTLVRFPGGSNITVHKNEIVKTLHSMNYKYVDWNCETGDGSDKKLQEKDTFSWYKDTCKDNIIVLLMHDYNYQTYSNLKKIIKDLKNRNYLILPLSNRSVMTK